ncbi:MAG: hypothetical protein HQL67_06325 [Magnetococcales bacterium]|nr:hypothetical protein [Magnetococcales bacterium]
MNGEFLKNSRRPGGFFFILATILFFGFGGQAKAGNFAKEVALVLQVSGQAELIRDSRGRELKRPLSVSNSLTTGNKIILGQDSQVVVIQLDDFKKSTFTGPDEITVNESELISKKGSSEVDQVGSQTASNKKGSNLLTALREGRPGGIRLRSLEWSKKQIVLLQPSDVGIIMDNSPTFRWDPLDNVGPYRFILNSDSGVPIFEALVDEHSVTLPSNIKLEDGQSYAWRVTVGQSVKGSDVSIFSVITADQRQGLALLQKKAETSLSDQVLYGLLLEKLGLLSEAKNHWKLMSEMHPEDPFFQRRSR